MASRTINSTTFEFRPETISNLLKQQQIKIINEVNRHFNLSLSTNGVKAELTDRIMGAVYKILDSNNPSSLSTLRTIVRETLASNRNRFNSRSTPEPAREPVRSHRPPTFSHVPLMAEYRPPPQGYPNNLTTSLGAIRPANDTRTLKQLIHPHRSIPSMAPPNPSRNAETDLMHPDFSILKFLRFKDSFFYTLFFPLSPFRIFKSPHAQSHVDLHLTLTDSNIEFLTSKRMDGVIPGLKLFCAPVSEFQKSLQPDGPKTFVKFPESCELLVNSNPVVASIRGKKNKPGSTRAPDLHPHIKLNGTNQITLRYLKAPENFLIVCQLVHINPIPLLVKKIVENNTVAKDDSKTILFGDDNEDGDLVATFELSLRCPVGFVRITEPFRSSHCKHAQCFDGTTFLQMNEQIETWTCPVCSISIDPSKDLIQDGYFLDILQNTTSDLDSVLVNSDGSWVIKKSEPETEPQLASNPAPVSPREEDVIELSDSDDDSSTPPTVIENQGAVIDLTETDDELDDANSLSRTNQTNSPNDSNPISTPNHNNNVAFPAVIPYPQNPWSESLAPAFSNLTRLPGQTNDLVPGTGQPNPINSPAPDFNPHPCSLDSLPGQSMYPSLSSENNNRISFSKINSTQRHFLAQPDPSP